jgi:1-acyl-sn-glycerol-3-phosphate acyltransferase
MIALFIIGWIAFTGTMTWFFHEIWMIPLWIIAGLPVGFLFMFGIIVAILYVWLPFLKEDSKIKSFLTKSCCKFATNVVCNITTTYEGTENVPKDGRVVIYCNHKSKLDPIILAQILPRTLLFTPKYELMKVIFLGPWMKAIGCEPIFRDDDKKTMQTIVRVIQKIKRGIAFIVFPEGTSRNKDSEELSKTRVGAYKVALKAEADIIPATIHGSSLIGVNAPFKNSKVHVIFHKPIKFEEFKNLNTTEIAELVEPVINETVNNSGDLTDANKDI